jgi:large subunit ribosomal protein L23
MGFFDKFKKYNAGTEKKRRPGAKSALPVAEKSEAKEEMKDKTVAETKRERKEDTGNAYRVLVKPLITEKASALSVENKYVFEVSPSTNKMEVKKAIYNVYGVEATEVNIMNMGGKKVRYGRTMGRTKNKKKAIITLKPGEKIELYEGV